MTNTSRTAPNSIASAFGVRPSSSSRGGISATPHSAFLETRRPVRDRFALISRCACSREIPGRTRAIIGGSGIVVRERIGRQDHGTRDRCDSGTWMRRQHADHCVRRAIEGHGAANHAGVGAKLAPQKASRALRHAALAGRSPARSMLVIAGDEPRRDGARRPRSSKKPSPASRRRDAVLARHHEGRIDLRRRPLEPPGAIAPVDVVGRRTAISPRCGCCSSTATRRSETDTGSGRHTAASITLNTNAVAPMPSARHTMAIASCGARCRRRSPA